jgi:hypothetical protein
MLAQAGRSLFEWPLVVGVYMTVAALSVPFAAPKAIVMTN